MFAYEKNKSTKKYTFIKFESYFKSNKFDIEKAEIISIISRFRAFIFGATRNFMFDTSGNYSRVRKALNKAISDHSEFRVRFVNKKKFIFTIDELLINPDTQQLEMDELLENLLSFEIKSNAYPELLKIIFTIINDQDKYCKAIEFNTLVTCIYKYFIVLKYLPVEIVEPHGSFDNEFKHKLNELLREPPFQIENYKSNLYIYTCEIDALNHILPQIPIERILERIAEKKFRNPTVLEVVLSIFSFLNSNSQKEYCKAIIHYNLLNALLRYYRSSFL